MNGATIILCLSAIRRHRLIGREVKLATHLLAQCAWHHSNSPPLRAYARCDGWHALTYHESMARSGMLMRGRRAYLFEQLDSMKLSKIPRYSAGKMLGQANRFSR